MQELRNSEIDDLQASVGGEAQIPGLQVTVDNALLMRGAKPFGKLHAQTKDLVGGDRPGRNQGIQICAGYVFGHEKIGAVLRAEFVDGRDVGVIQPGERQGFLAELFACRGIAEQAREQDLDGDITIEVLIVREVDNAHSAGTDLIHDPVM
jgi:hypothetical protein